MSVRGLAFYLGENGIDESWIIVPSLGLKLRLAWCNCSQFLYTRLADLSILHLEQDVG
jgi:hypothetical protein